MGVYDNLNATAKRLIDKWSDGRTVTLLKSGSVPVDPTKPWRGQTAIATEGDGTAVTASAVFLNQADEDNFGRKEMDTDGTLMKRGRQRVLISDLDLSADEDIDQFDILQDGTRMYRIVDANILEPGGVRIMYDLTVEQ